MNECFVADYHNLHMKLHARALTYEPFTLLIPLNKGLPTDASFLTDREYTRQVLLNHVILGDIVNLEAASSGAAPYYSLADNELSFVKDNAGNVMVNDVRLTGQEFLLDNLVVYLIEKAIPLSPPEFLKFVPVTEDIERSGPIVSDIISFVTLAADTSTTQSSTTPVVLLDAKQDSFNGNEVSKSTPRPTRFDKFRKAKNEILTSVSETTTKQSLSIEKSLVSTIKANLKPIETDNSTSTKESIPENQDVEVLDMIDVGEFSEMRQRLSFNTTFLSSMLRELNTPHAIGSEFIHHFLEADLGKYLSPDRNYTAIIPTNEAFYYYYPIDWGFNPFLVQNFTKDVLLNHILEGDIHLYEFNDDVEIHTIADRVIKVVKDKAGTVLINGHKMPIETEIEVQNGRLYFIHHLLFVDFERVNALRLEYPFLETAPLLSFPWPSSPFLSHLLKRLQEEGNTKYFAHLLRNSDISHLVFSSDENLNRLTYTAFVPTDDSLKKTFRVENLATLNPKIINNFLLEHIVSGYLLEEDFEDGFNLLTLTNKVIPITINNNTGDIFVEGSKIQLPQQYIYNLGALFILDKPLKDLATTEPLSKISKLEGNEIPLQNQKTELEKASDNKLHKVENSFNTPLPQKDGHTESSVSIATPQPEIIYEVRTEISFSRQINDGEIVPVSRDVVERARLI
ncbi:hypothetical protein Anas_11337 [Armadillidium nasatum]|uniref:FAS1 domain-containing protein n=1 Tax=Armadillidium nasatum TaxID=96803 RepID=A0A5N5TD20_9CRUS|nr:hypothetical protein Anas_11337 [Armadillidium nasatum]